MRTNLASLRTRWAAIGAAVAVTLGAAGIGSYNLVNADVASGDRPIFVPLNPCRLVDTRAAATVGPKSSPLGPNETLTVTAHGSNGNCTGPSAIPTDAVALSLNVTAVGQTQRTYLTIWGEGADPGTSNLNPEPGQPPTPNAVNTPLSTAGTFNVRNNAGNVNTLIDVVGYYANHNHDDRYTTLDGLGARLVVRVSANASGSVYDAGTPPEGVTMEVTKTSTGRYSVEFDGLLGLGIADTEYPLLLLAQSIADVTCLTGGGSASLLGGTYASISRTINCRDDNGAFADSNVQFVFIL